MGLRVARMLALLVLAGIAVTTPGFLSWPSILSLLTTVSFIGCVGVGMTLITISGNIMSFSLGSTVGAAAMIFVASVNAFGVPAAFVIALLFGGFVSGVQGLVIGLFRANPIIVSIASLSLIYGIAEAFAESGTIYAVAGTDYGLLKGAIFGIPREFLALLLLTGIAQFILVFTTFGRNLLMVGSSFQASEAVGIKTWRTVTGAFIWAGLCAGLAGVMLAIRYDSASMAYGFGYDYDAVAAVLVGGTAIKGGQGSAVRTLVGALVIAIIQVVLLLQGFRQEWQYFIAGLVVLAVIILQTRGVRD